MADTKPAASSNTLLQRVNEACQAESKAQGYKYRLLDDDTVISYCRQVVAQRIYQRTRGKAQRQRMQEMEVALTKAGIKI